MYSFLRAYRQFWLNETGCTESKGANNLAFATLFQLGDVGGCTDLLVKTHREPEAALFARTYAPSQAQKAVEAWKGELRSKGRPKIAAAIATPAENVDLFEEGWENALKKEKGEENGTEKNATEENEEEEEEGKDEEKDEE